jgi:hypothetical protein
MNASSNNIREGHRDEMKLSFFLKSSITRSSSPKELENMSTKGTKQELIHHYQVQAKPM